MQLNETTLYSTIFLVAETLSRSIIQLLIDELT